jgi:hypothetical protein
MPTGRALSYAQYQYLDLKQPVRLLPPQEAHRVYLLAEGGIVRYITSADGPEGLTPSCGMPLVPEFPEEFDTDLHQIYVIAAQQDVTLNAYYYRSS